MVEPTRRPFLIFHVISLVTQFQSFANTVKDASEFHLRDITLSMKDMASLMTDTACQTDQKFPFVTMPAFETMGESVRRKAGLEAIYYGPLIMSEQVMEWQEYSLQNQGWLENSRHTVASSTYGAYNPGNYKNGSITPFMFNIDGDGVFSLAISSDPPYMPIWHASPPPFDPAFINFNGYPAARGILGAVAEAREGLFAWPDDLSGFAEVVITEEDHNAIHASLVDWVKDGSNSTFDHPHSFFSEPVFEELNNSSSKLVGYIAALVAWDRYLIDLLPEGVTGITCVLKASYRCKGCDPSVYSDWWDGEGLPVKEFTYLLDGNSVCCGNELKDGDNSKLTPVQLHFSIFLFCRLSTLAKA